jgi:TP901 family phage tail tape measure protein
VADKIEIEILAHDKASGPIKGVVSSLGGLGTLAAGAVVGGIAAAGGAMVALGASSIGVAREFESSIAVMSTAVDPLSVGVETSAEAMKILSDASLAVGGDMDLIGVSGSSAAEAMTGLYKAGLTTGEIFGDLQGYLAGTAELGGALRASIDLAAASELDMVQASELAAVTLATFGGHLETEAERGEFLNAAMNNLVQAADASVASVSDLQAALVNVGPTASAMGIPLEDVNTALAILSTRGIAGSEAGTQLKSMLLNMQSTSKPVQKALSELGISLYDLEGNMYTLPQIMSQVENAFVGLTEKQQDQYMKTLAGSYGISAMSALLGEGTQGWIDMEAAIGEAATMQESAAARTNTLAGAQEALAGVWETFQIKVGTALIPVLTLLAEVGATLIDRYGPVLIGAFESFAAVMERLFNWITVTVQAIQAGGFEQLFVVFEDGSSRLGSLIEVFGVGEEKAQALASGIINLVNQVRTFVEPIAAAVTQFVSWKDVLIALGGIILAAVVPAIVGLVVSMAPIILTVGAVIAAVALLRNAWESNWGGIQEKTRAVIDFIRNAIETGLSAIRAFWDAHGEQIMSIARTAWEFIQSTIIDLVTAIRTGVEQSLAGLRDFWDTWGKSLLSLATGIWEAIKSLIQGTVEQIKLIVQLFQAAFEGDWRRFGQLLFEIWQNAWETVINVLRNLWSGMQPILSQLWGSIQSWWNGIDWASLGRRVIDGIIAGLRAAGGAIAGVITGLAQSAIDAAKAALGIQSPSKVFFDIGVQIAQGLLRGIISMEDEVFDRTAAMFEQLSKIGNLGGAFGGFFAAGTIDPLKQKIDSFTSSINDMVKDLKLPENFLQLDIGMQRRMLRDQMRSGDPQAAATARVLNSFLDERRKLQAELIKQQQKIAELEEKRAQINFLQQQFELLKLIKDNNLGTEILNGLKLGLDADPAALMDAMKGALQKMIDAAEYQLGISSPSKWAVNLGKNVMGTLGKTLKGDAPLLSRDVSTAIGGGFNGGVRNVGGNRSTVVNIDARGAQRGVDRDLRRMVYDIMREAGVKGDIRLRTS